MTALCDFIIPFLSRHLLSNSFARCLAFGMFIPLILVYVGGLLDLSSPARCQRIVICESTLCANLSCRDGVMSFYFENELHVAWVALHLSYSTSVENTFEYNYQMGPMYALRPIKKYSTSILSMAIEGSERV